MSCCAMLQEMCMDASPGAQLGPQARAVAAKRCRRTGRSVQHSVLGSLAVMVSFMHGVV